MFLFSRWNIKFSCQFVKRMSCSYSYSDQDSWTNGKRQSPIDINSKDANKAEWLLPISYEGNKVLRGQWTNTGHSIQFDPAKVDLPILRTHTGQYVLRQFHFHWGHSSGIGSEHLVDSTSQDAELHLVHKKIGGSQTDKDYLTVLGVLLKRDKAVPIAGTIWEQLVTVPQSKESVELRDVDITQLIPANKSYWYYEGSLTTPPCSETVQWFVFKQVLPVSELVVDMWSTTPHDAPLPCNYRKVQPLNGREVWFLEQ